MLSERSVTTAVGGWGRSVHASGKDGKRQYKCSNERDPCAYMRVPQTKKGIRPGYKRAGAVLRVVASYVQRQSKRSRQLSSRAIMRKSA